MFRLLGLLLPLLELLSRWEFVFWAQRHNRKQWIRRLYLHCIGAKYGRHVYCGPDILIRLHGNLELGERCSLGYAAKIWNYSPVCIGEDFMAAAGLIINTGSHNVETMEPFSLPITIGKRVWCGLNVTILAGVTIGDDVVVGAGSVVVNDIPSGVVVAGTPARVIRQLDRDLEKFWRPIWV